MKHSWSTFTISYCKPHSYSTDWRTSSQLEGNTGHVKRMWTSQLRVETVTYVLSHKPKPFSIFQTAQTPPPRGQRKQAKFRSGIFCPKTYIRMDSDSSSFTSADGRPVYLEVCTSFLCSWDRRVQQKPAHACTSPAKTRDKLCSTWDCGGSPGTACQHSRWAISQDQAVSPPQLLFVITVFSRMEMRGLWVYPFFAYYRTFSVLYSNVYHSPHHFKVPS